MGLPAFDSYPLPTVDEIPKARGPWQLAPQRAAILVHDMQQYFLRHYAADASPLAPVIANIQRLLTAARQAGAPVYYTCQKGNQNPQKRGLQKDLWGAGMSAIDEHEQVVDGIRPQAGDTVLTKHRYSAFQQSNFAERLQQQQRDQLIVCGVYAHIGCFLTAADAFQYDIAPFMAADAVADFSRAKHDMTLQHLADCCGVPLTTDRIEELLHG